MLYVGSFAFVYPLVQVFKKSDGSTADEIVWFFSAFSLSLYVLLVCWTCYVRCCQICSPKKITIFDTWSGCESTCCGLCFLLYKVILHCQRPKIGWLGGRAVYPWVMWLLFIIGPPCCMACFYGGDMPCCAFVAMLATRCPWCQWHDQLF